ncbi:MULTISPECIES: DNA-binding protein [Pseudomonadaceae]|jgi:hypothetical protein|uniref:DNA-binding protein n=1 Tax=Stutzerimonas stutzeri TaxID=316 RepID=A0A2N8R955_STUST|nr:MULTISPECIES: DNA-binding protein [Pseudomonadaceae]MCQ4256273.1 DNA-binding protein [Stutzerimonas stutzeri]PNF57628.1 DNA-binding protein [Stutzerimonas stutzeri]
MDRSRAFPSLPAGVQLAQLESLKVEIPAQALAALAEALDQIAKGRAVDLQGVPPEVATREAAALLNLPHPRLLQLLDDGAIASRMANGRRRVQVVDLVAYRQAAQAEASSTAMNELATLSEDLKLGY